MEATCQFDKLDKLQGYDSKRPPVGRRSRRGEAKLTPGEGRICVKRNAQMCDELFRTVYFFATTNSNS